MLITPVFFLYVLFEKKKYTYRYEQINRNRLVVFGCSVSFPSRKINIIQYHRKPNMKHKMAHVYELKQCLFTSKIKLARVRTLIRRRRIKIIKLI